MLRKLLLPVLIAGSLAACQTANRPVEISNAEEALDRASEANLNNSMPRAMELAKRKYEDSKRLFKQSTDEDQAANASAVRQQAIQLAREAAAIVDAGLNLRDDVNSFDNNLVVKGDDKLTTENRNLRNQITQLQQQLTQAQANQGAGGGEGIQNFELSKAVAYFPTGSDEILDEYSDEIDEVAETLKAHENLYLTLVGWADPRGSSEQNQKLSANRAQTVMQKLIDKGIEENRIRMVGRGEVSDTATADQAKLQLDRKVVAEFGTVAH